MADASTLVRRLAAHWRRACSRAWQRTACRSRRRRRRSRSRSGRSDRVGRLGDAGASRRQRPGRLPARARSRPNRRPAGHAAPGLARPADAARGRAAYRALRRSRRPGRAARPGAGAARPRGAAGAASHRDRQRLQDRESDAGRAALGETLATLDRWPRGCGWRGVALRPWPPASPAIGAPVHGRACRHNRPTGTKGTNMARIGFIGASGLMGHGIAKNLLS